MDMIEAPLGRREKRKQEIRARIEEAAYTLFKLHGLDDTSIEMICERADVARRTFYAHYPNKHALLGGLGVSRLYDQSGPMLRQLMENHHTTRERLGAMIDYVEANFANYEEVDRQLMLAASNGTHVPCEIVPLPFYDSENGCYSGGRPSLRTRRFI